MTEQGKHFYHQNVFVFSFESQKRCMTPQRFLVKEKKGQAFVLFYNNDDDVLFVNILDGAGCSLGNEKSNT